jgi:hypothetical protein
MWMILLEALGALLLLMLIVWWTMFSGRPQSPPPQSLPTEPDGPQVPDARADTSAAAARAKAPD